MIRRDKLTKARSMIDFLLTAAIAFAAGWLACKAWKGDFVALREWAKSLVRK